MTVIAPELNPGLPPPPSISSHEVEMFLSGIDAVRHHLDDGEVSELMVNNHENVILEKAGKMIRLDVKLNKQKLRGAIMALANSINTPLTPGTDLGIVNAGHKNLRIAAVTEPTAMDGDALSIRRHREANFNLDDYAHGGSFSRSNALPDVVEENFFIPGIEGLALARALNDIVVAKKNIIVAGGTSAGKTSVLNAMGKCIPPEDRVISIEDTSELQLQAPNMVRLLSNKAKRVTTLLLVQLCLRMRPDRIVVGEVRGAEAYDLLQALYTGHDGGFATLHSSDARTALSRLESMAMLGIPEGARIDVNDMRKTVSETIDYVIHFRRTENLRHVSEILEVRGFDGREYQLKRVF